jgi:tRNA threonylcarbamoyladenosine biosynthesis protein TsaE
MVTFISHSPADTAALGEKLGRRARPGFIFALSGDLGAGKTQFVKGLARGLDVSVRIHSPTFTLVNEYTGGRLKFFHLDLYRLETPEQIASVGIGEFLTTDGIAVIEWAERLKGSQWLMPGRNHWVQVKIEILSDADRTIFYDDFSA